MLPPDMLDALVKDAYANGGALGAQELLNEMTKAVLERALDAEMTHYLGYEKGDPAGNGSGNSRNGRSPKTVSTTNGPVELAVPRDRKGSFEPAIVPKRARRLGNIDEAILSLYSRGMTTRDIESHLREVYGVNVSRELVSNVTEVVADQIALWQSRPLDEIYPILYVDGLRLRVKDKGVVTSKVAYLAVGVDIEGRKHALGLWIADTEAAKFWAKVVTDLRNRGVKDILIACCNGLTGLPDAIRGAFPDAVVQTCVVHVIRNAMRFISYGDRKKVAAAMREIYTAPTLEAAEIALTHFDKDFGTQYPAAIQVWRHAWNDFIPFLDYPPELRRIVYTTNLIENINFQLRKITKNRGHFDSDAAATKLLYLGLRNITSNRGGPSGTGTRGWKQTLNTLAALFPGRLPLH
ncbi:transposase [Amycolatopsis lurida NRRL 2430]|uniref:Mutator family transposase n=2 Tax=Amycolatopsis lurida TaxID=31959 RepID=A0A2P2FJK1_AMYLU|nr:transposase [Amycolatopsis lurida NRRL 2430]